MHPLHTGRLGTEATLNGDKVVTAECQPWPRKGARLLHVPTDQAPLQGPSSIVPPSQYGTSVQKKLCEGRRARRGKAIPSCPRRPVLRATAPLGPDDSKPPPLAVASGPNTRSSVRFHAGEMVLLVLLRSRSSIVRPLPSPTPTVWVVDFSIGPAEHETLTGQACNGPKAIRGEGACSGGVRRRVLWESWTRVSEAHAQSPPELCFCSPSCAVPGCDDGGWARLPSVGPVALSQRGHVDAHHVGHCKSRFYVSPRPAPRQSPTANPHSARAVRRTVPEIAGRDGR